MDLVRKNPHEKLPNGLTFVDAIRADYKHLAGLKVPALIEEYAKIMQRDGAWASDLEITIIVTFIRPELGHAIVYVLMGGALCSIVLGDPKKSGTVARLAYVGRNHFDRVELAGAGTPAAMAAFSGAFSIVPRFLLCGPALLRPLQAACLTTCWVGSLAQSTLVPPRCAECGAGRLSV